MVCTELLWAVTIMCGEFYACMLSSVSSLKIERADHVSCWVYEVMLIVLLNILFDIRVDDWKK